MQVMYQLTTDRHKGDLLLNNLLLALSYFDSKTQKKI